MAELSISRAWEETKARIAADGRLIAIVAAALVVLPGIISGAISPRTTGSEGGFIEGLVFLLSSLLAMIGQLAIIRLAIGPAVSVGEAISHGTRRMPYYLVAGVIVLVGLFLALVPFIAIAYVMGVPFESGNERAVVESPVGLVLMLLYLAMVCFVAIRLILSSPVASEEPAAPIGILRRSWELTSGHWWRLFGFLILFLIGAGIALTAVNWGVGLVAVVLFGPIEPMSLSALLLAIVDSCLNAAMTVILAVILARIYVQLAVTEPRSVPKSGT